MDFISEYKSKIDKNIIFYLNRYKDSLPDIQPLQSKMISSFADFSVKGKTLRGSLFCYMHTILNKKESKEAIQIATALELFHSSLLIHDDIIDNDRLRRGSSSIWYLFSNNGKDKNYGSSIALCLGDVGFFTGFSILSSLTLHDSIKVKLNSLFSNELTKVTLAEAADSHYGYHTQLPSINTIQKIYTYKTARYTFSLPLIAACIVSGKVQYIKLLDNLGEIIGYLYQLKDDELSILGDSKITGKPIANDLFEKKKTLLFVYLVKHCNKQELKTIHSFLRKENVDNNDIQIILNLIEKYEIIKTMKNQQGKLIIKANNCINSLPFSETVKRDLEKLVNYCYTREK